MKYWIISFIALFAINNAAFAQDLSHRAHEEESGHYDATRDADADVNAMLAKIAENGKMGIVVLGANWCHDSRALAAHFEKPRFQTLLRNHYKMTYIDVGKKNRNIDLARKFGVDNIVGTPTIFVTDSDGKVLNLETAPTESQRCSSGERFI